MGRTRGPELIKHDRAFGARFVAGADEAGRGCLAGPLVAAAVCLDLGTLDPRARHELAELADSKVLTKKTRERLYDVVFNRAAAVSVQIVEPDEIDQGGVHKANLAALTQALREVCPPAELLLSDHYRLELDDHLAITRGDSTSAAIAAAAVVAKVTRDRLMQDYATLYPHYGFEKNVGYMTRAHQDAVVSHGPTPLHRLSFAARCYAEHLAQTGPQSVAQAAIHPGRA